MAPRRQAWRPLLLALLMTTLAACSENPREGPVSLDSDGTSWWLWHRGTGEKRWLPAVSRPWTLHHHNSMAYVTDGQITSRANEYFEESLLTDAADTWLYNRVERSFGSFSVRLRAFLRYAVCLRSSDLRADAMVLTVPRHANVCIYWEARGVSAWAVGDLASKSEQEDARWHLNRWQTWAKLVADAGMDRALLEKGVSPMARRQAPGQSSALPFDRASMSSGPLVFGPLALRLACHALRMPNTQQQTAQGPMQLSPPFRAPSSPALQISLSRMARTSWCALAMVPASTSACYFRRGVRRLLPAC